MNKFNKIHDLLKTISNDNVENQISLINDQISNIYQSTPPKIIFEKSGDSFLGRWLSNGSRYDTQNKTIYICNSDTKNNKDNTLFIYFHEYRHFLQHSGRTPLSTKLISAIRDIQCLQSILLFVATFLSLKYGKGNMTQLSFLFIWIYSTFHLQVSSFSKASQFCEKDADMFACRFISTQVNIFKPNVFNQVFEWMIKIIPLSATHPDNSKRHAYINNKIILK